MAWPKDLNLPEAVLVGIDAMQAEGIHEANKIIPNVRRWKKYAAYDWDVDQRQYWVLISLVGLQVVRKNIHRTSVKLLIEAIDLTVQELRSKQELRDKSERADWFRAFFALLFRNGWVFDAVNGYNFSIPGASVGRTYIVLGDGRGNGFRDAIGYLRGYKNTFKRKTWLDDCLHGHVFLTPSEWFKLESHIGAIVTPKKVTLYKNANDLTDAWISIVGELEG